MSETVSAKDHALAEAERINSERMKVVEDLATAVEERVELERLLAEAQKREKRLMGEAEKVGWTRKQVTTFAKPPKRSTPRQQSGSSNGTASDQPGSTSATGAQSQPADEASADAPQERSVH